MIFITNITSVVLKSKHLSIKPSGMLSMAVPFSITRKMSEKTNSHEDELPDPNISNPYLKEKPQCILCRYQIQVDYKNVRLLSQFVSPYTGRLYDKHITGLCEKQHRLLKRELKRALDSGLISMFYRDPKYNNDPKLFDPTRPQRPNPY